MISKLIIAVLISVAFSGIVSMTVSVILAIKITQYVILKIDDYTDNAINEMLNQKNLSSNVQNKEDFTVKKGRT